MRTLALSFALSLAGIASLSGGTITGTFSTVAPGSNMDLTGMGKSDWVHWGLYSSSSINRKSEVQGQISDFTTFGNLPESVVPAYQYSDDFSGFTWEDGTPVSGVTNTTTGVYCIQDFPWNPVAPPTGFGFQITAPADTTPRTLNLFVGAYSAVGKLQATLSDGGPGYTDISLTNSANGPGGLYTLNYKANSAGQTLTIKWSLIARAGSDTNKANVTLQAASLSVSNANNPPFVTLTNPTPQSSFAAPASIDMEASAQDFDGTVTNVEFYVGNIKVGQSMIPPYSFIWNNAPTGHYFLTALAYDNAGAQRFSMPVEIFVYGTGGILQGGVAASPPTVDLTTEGAADWTHWGLITNLSFDYKTGVPRQISNFSLLGTNTVTRYTNNYTSFSWSDGTPTAGTAGTQTGVFVTGLKNGFSLTAPADTNMRTLKVYVGCYGAQGMFQASLSDLSAQPYIDSSVSSYGDDYEVYTVTYAASAAGQNLNVSYQLQNLFDYDFGNVTLQSATLQTQSVITAAPVRILQPEILAGQFVFRFLTETNHDYEVQVENSLTGSNWTAVTNLAGTGGTITVTNQIGGAQQNFYRVQTH